MLPIRGCDLSEHCQGIVTPGGIVAPFSIPKLKLEFRDSLYQIVGALAYAHSKGVAHADLKPGNVIRGERGTFLIDFSLARASAPGSIISDLQHMIPPDGTVQATPKYISPEQATDGRNFSIDDRTDLYSLGIMLYEHLTGRHPWPQQTAGDYLIATCVAKPAPPSEVNPGVPAALSALCMKLLEKNPENRPSNAPAVLGALHGAYEADRQVSRAAA